MASKHKHHNRKYNKKSSKKKISKKPLYLKDKKKQPKLPTLDLMAVYLRIYLNDEQYMKSAQTGGCRRLVYNNIVADYYEKKKQFLEDKKNGKNRRYVFKIWKGRCKQSVDEYEKE